MKPDFDPYLPPLLDEESEAVASVVQEPKTYPYRYSYTQQCLLVHIENHHLPQRCVCCNANIVEYKKHTLHWQTSFMYVLLMINFLIFFVMYFLTRKKITLSIGLCQEHVNQRNLRFLVFLLMLVTSVISPIISPLSILSMWWLLLLLFFGGLMGLLRFSGPLRVTMVEPEWVHIKGCGEDFVDSLDVIDDDENPRETDNITK